MSAEQLSPEDAAYWKQALAGAPPMLAVPTDAPRPSRQETTQPDSASVACDLSGDEVAQLTQLGQVQNVGLASVLSAAFSVLLQRYCREDDLVLGVVAGDTVLPVRLQLSDDQPFLAQAANMQTAIATAAEHAQDVSYQQLAEVICSSPATGVKRGDALLQVVFGLSANKPKTLQCVRARTGHLPDVGLQFMLEGDSLKGTLEYNTQLFKPRTADGFVSHFKALVSSIMATPTGAVSALNMLPAAERAVVLEQFNNTSAPCNTDRCIHEVFQQFVEQTPEAPCLVFQNQTLTYAETDLRANQLAHNLLACGVKTGSAVGILLERSHDLVISMLAIMKAGAAYVPLDPEYPQERLEMMLEDSACPVVITTSLLQTRISATADTGTSLTLLDKAWPSIQARRPSTPPEVQVSSGDLAYIIFTSGSTGRPKGTLLRHAGLINYLGYLTARHALGAADVFLQKTPVSFDVSVRELFFPLLCGGSLVLAPPGLHRDTGFLATLAEDAKVTCASFVPSQLEIFLQEVAPGSCPALRKVFVSGEALPATSVALFYEHLPHAQLINLYGPTEATVDVTEFVTAVPVEGNSVPIGRPIQNTKAFVLDSRLQPMPVGVPGELHLSGIQLARGYLNRPEVTAEKFIANPYGEGDYARMYKTGDLCRWLPNGTIEFLGRIDFQVKLRGFRIELGEVESHICQVPGVRQAVATIHVDPITRRQVLVAYVTPKAVETSAAVKHLSSCCPDYMIPSLFVTMDVLPSLPNGKINRRALPVPELSGIADEEQYLPPVTPAQIKMQGIWQQVLGMEPISIDSDFFIVGGNSLTASKVVSRTRTAFGLPDLPLSTIFLDRTIEALAGVVDMQLGEAARGSEQSLTRGPYQRPGNSKASDTQSGWSSEERGSEIRRAYRKSQVTAGVPVAFTQELLLLNNEIDPGHPAHNEPFWVRLKGELNVEALGQALRYMVDRHDVLRTKFAVGVGGPMQIVVPKSDFQLPLAAFDAESGEALKLPKVVARRSKQAARSAEKAERQAEAAAAALEQQNHTWLDSLNKCGHKCKDWRDSSSCSDLSHPTPQPSRTGSGMVAAASEPAAEAAAEEEEEEDVMKEIEQMAARVKKAVMLHYLTFGLYGRYLQSKQHGTPMEVQRVKGFTKDLRFQMRRMLCCLTDPTKAQPFALKPPAPEPHQPHSSAAPPPPEERLLQMITAESQKPFQLQQGPLLRFILYRVAEGDHVLLVNMHHTICDGWSMYVLFDEIGRAYDAYRSGGEPNLPALPIQYVDFSAWHRQYLAAGILRKQLNFWQEYLSGACPILELPTDHPRPAVPSHHGGRVPMVIPMEVTRRLRQLMAATHTTMFMALLAAFKTLLYRLSACDDVIVGAPVAGRTSVETEGLIGAFLGCVAIRTDLGGEPSFRELLHRVRSASLEAYTNADTPVHKVMEKVAMSNDKMAASYAPIFQSMLFLHQADWLSPLHMEGVEVSEVQKIEKNVARFDLTLELTENGDDIRGDLEYSADLFEPATAQRFVHHLQVLLEAVAAQPDMPISRLPLETEARPESVLLNPVSTAAALGVAAQLSNGEELRLAVLDRFHQQQPRCFAGELYFVEAGETAPVLRSGSDPVVPSQPQGKLFRAGYNARVDAEGNLHILGSVANKVTLHLGFHVQLEEVEGIIRAACPQATAVAVSMAPNPQGQDVLVAHIAPAEVDTTDLDLTLRKQVPLHLVPELYMTAAALPTDAWGHVDRERLPPANWKHRVVAPYAPPRNALEMQLQLIWQSLLNRREMLSVHADFAEVGGSLLTAVIMNGIIREVMGVTMPAMVIFRQRTIAGVAAYIRARRSEMAAASGLRSSSKAAKGKPPVGKPKPAADTPAAGPSISSADGAGPSDPGSPTQQQAEQQQPDVEPPVRQRSRRWPSLAPNILK